MKTKRLEKAGQFSSWRAGFLGGRSVSVGCWLDCWLPLATSHLSTICTSIINRHKSPLYHRQISARDFNSARFDKAIPISSSFSSSIFDTQISTRLGVSASQDEANRHKLGVSAF